MTRWDYLRRPIKSPAIEMVMKELGRDGWELVLQLEKEVFLFKRPLGT